MENTKSLTELEGISSSISSVFGPEERVRMRRVDYEGRKVLGQGGGEARMGRSEKGREEGGGGDRSRGRKRKES